jgi:hypothetical protein
LERARLHTGAPAYAARAAEILAFPEPSETDIAAGAEDSVVVSSRRRQGVGAPQRVRTA